MNTLTRRPITPAVSDAWHTRGACQDEDPDLFFPVGFSHAADKQAEEAKKVCGRCLVREECLSWALETRQDVGVLGGLSQQERWALGPGRTTTVRMPGVTSPAQDRCWESVEQIAEWRAQKVSGAQIAKRLGIGTDAFYRWVKRYDAERSANAGVVAEEVAA